MLRLGPAMACALLLVAAAWLAQDQAQRSAADLPALDDAGPPLASAPPALLPAQPRSARRVVLVLIDGLRADGVRGMPALEALAARGAAGVASAAFPTSSVPNYTAILTGVPPRASGVRTNQYAGPVPLDDLFTRVRAGGGRTAFVTQLSGMVATLFPAIDVVLVAPGPGPAIDRAATRIAEQRPDLLVVLHNGPDEAAHRHGAASPEYRAARLDADRTLAAVVAALDLERDAIVVVADHGHTATGGHGGTEPEVTRVPLVLAGAGVRPGARLEGATTSDVAPTVAALLGLPAPGHALGRTLAEGLLLDAGRARATDAARRAALAPFEAAPARLAAVDEVRRARAGIAGAALLALALGLGWARRRRALVLDPGAVGLALAAALAPLVILAVAVGRPTPSFIAMPDAVPGAVARLAALLVPALAAALLSRGRRLARAAGTAAITLLVIGSAAATLWVLVDDALATTFFGPAALVVPPLVHAALALSAMSVALALAGGLLRGLWLERLAPAPKTIGRAVVTAPSPRPA